MGSYKYDLFISYAKEDSYWVKGYLMPMLEKSNLKLITPEDFRIGYSKINELEDAILNSRFTLAIFSHSYIVHDWSVLTEQLVSHLSTESGKSKIIPIKLKHAPLPLRIQFRILLDFSDHADWESESEKLMKFLNADFSSETEVLKCPYPGMVPFNTENSSDFFGRTEEIQQVLYTANNQKILCIIGASGSGKSSLVFGGVIPALKSLADTKNIHWSVKDMRPGSSPMTRLNLLLENKITDAAGRITKENERFCLVVDQFEELFTISEKAETAAFFQALSKLKKENNCFIILTMRAAFYQDLMACPIWPLTPPEKLEITALSSDRLSEAIVNPSKNIGVYIEPGLVESLINDAASEPGTLPLIQEAMILLWEKRDNRLISQVSYKALGKSGLGIAISKKADTVFYKLSEEQQKMARRLFLRLIQFGEGRPDTRRQQPIELLTNADEDPIEFNNCLQLLSDHRLITIDGEEFGNRTNVDISHESLIETWTTLSSWIKEKREAEQIRRRLQVKAEEWVRLGRKNGGLLDIIEISESTEWLKSIHANEIGFSSDIVELIKQSSLFQENLSKEKERAEKQHSEKLKKRAYILFIFLCISVLTTMFALRQIKIANSRKLAAEALTVQEQIGTALKLSLEAYDISNNDETKSSLLSILAQSSQFDKILQGHSSFAWKIKCSPDGKFAASAHNGGSVNIWDARSGKLVKTLASYRNKGVFALEYSKDGRRLYSGGDGGYLIAYDMVNMGAADTLMRLKDEAVFSIAVSFDNKFLAVGSKSKIYIIDLTTGNILPTVLQKHKKTVRSLAFSPNSYTLASGSEDKTVLLWDVATMSLLTKKPLDEHAEEIHSLCFSPDGTMLVSGSGDDADRCLIIWDVYNKISLSYPLYGHTSGVMDITFTRSGDTMYTCSADKRIIAWNMNSFTEIRQLKGHWAQINSVCLSPDGSRLFSAGWDNNIYIWDVTKSNFLCEPIDADFKNPLQDIFPDDDSERLIMVDQYGVIAVGEESGKRKFSISQQTGYRKDRPTALVLSKKNNRLFYGDNYGMISVVDINSKKITAALPDVRRKYVDMMAISHDENILAAGGFGGVVTLWDTRTMKQLGPELKGHRGRIHDLSFSSDDRYLCVVYEYGSVLVWDLRNYQPVGKPLCEDGYMFAGKFSHNGKYIVYANSYDLESQVFIYDFEQQQSLPLLSAESMATVFSIEFTPDDKYLVLGGEGGTHIWDFKKRALVYHIPNEDETDKVSALSLSPDNRYSVSGLSSSIKMVSMETKQVKTIPTKFAIGAICFLNDSLFITQGIDSTLDIYNCRTGKLSDTWRNDYATKLNQAAYIPGLNLVVTVATDGKMRITPVKENATTTTFKISDTILRSIAIDQKKKEATIGGLDSILQVRDIRNPDKVGLQITSFPFSNNGKLIAVGGGDGSILLFNTTTHKQVGSVLKGHSRTVTCLTFNDDGSKLASGGADRLLFIWDTKNHRQDGFPLSAHGNSVWGLQFSPDGKYLASAGDDKTVRIWNSKNRNRMGSSLIAEGQIWSLKFSKDGNYLYTVGDNRKLERWDLNTDFWVKKAKMLINQE